MGTLQAAGDLARLSEVGLMPQEPLAMGGGVCFLVVPHRRLRRWCPDQAQSFPRGCASSLCIRSHPLLALSEAGFLLEWIGVRLLSSIRDAAVRGLESVLKRSRSHLKPLHEPQPWRGGPEGHEWLHRDSPYHLPHRALSKDFPSRSGAKII